MYSLSKQLVEERSSSFFVFMNNLERGWNLCEIMEHAGAGFHKPGQQQSLPFPVETGQDDYNKEI